MTALGFQGSLRVPEEYIHFIFCKKKRMDGHEENNKTTINFTIKSILPVNECHRNETISAFTSFTCPCLSSEIV